MKAGSGWPDPLSGLLGRLNKKKLDFAGPRTPMIPGPDPKFFKLVQVPGFKPLATSHRRPSCMSEQHQGGGVLLITFPMHRFELL